MTSLKIPQIISLKVRTTIVLSGAGSILALGLSACADLKAPKEIIDAARRNAGSTLAGKEVQPRTAPNQVRPDGSVRAAQSSTQGKAQARREPTPLVHNIAIKQRGAELADAAWPLAASRNEIVSINFLEKLSAPALYCIYREQGGTNRAQALKFWASSRPDLSRLSGLFPVDLDVALDACPATWGEAVTLGWGPTAWSELVAQQKEHEAAINAHARYVERMEKETPESRARDWLTAAKALPASSEADDLALARNIDAEIGNMESQIDTLNSRPFNDRLVKPGGLFERINRLGQIAYMKSRDLKATPAGRDRFDMWDGRLGGPALSAIARLEKIVYYRQNRRVRIAEVTADAGKSEMASWGNVDFSPVWAGQETLLKIFDQHLDGRPLISPAFQKQIEKDLARTRPNGDPGRAYYYHVPAEPKPTWMMTPQEQEAERRGKFMTNAFGLVTAVGDLIRLIDKVDADVREARIAFWKCYASRCNQAGETFYAYSYAMWNKDNFYFAGPVTLPGQLGKGFSFLGAGAIDGGPISHCSGPAGDLSTALSEAVKSGKNDPVRSTSGVIAVMKGPVYLKWQGCRDRMEYIMRPRFV